MFNMLKITLSSDDNTNDTPECKILGKKRFSGFSCHLVMFQQTAAVRGQAMAHGNAACGGRALFLYIVGVI